MASFLDQTGLTTFWNKCKSKFLALSGGTLTGDINTRSINILTPGTLTIRDNADPPTSYRMNFADVNGDIRTQIGQIGSNEDFRITVREANGSDSHQAITIENNSGQVNCENGAIVRGDAGLTTNKLIVNSGGGVQLKTTTPFIDFYYNNSSSFTSRIIAYDASGLSCTNHFAASGFYESSDATLKENIHSIPDSDIEKVKEIELKEFNFIDDKSKTKKYGVIAQEVEEAGLNNLVKIGNEDKKTVDYTSLLILKISQLEKEIKDLREELNELKSK